MAFELSRVDRLTKTYDLAARFPELSGPFTAATVALLAPRSGPNASTTWFTVSVASGIATVLFAGPDADPTGAVVVNGSADLWLKSGTGPEVDAVKVERISLLGGGPIPVTPLDRGVPSGGSAGQVLTKASTTPYDTEWDTPSAVPSGGAGGALSGTYPNPGFNDSALVTAMAGHVGDGSAFDLAQRAAYASATRQRLGGVLVTLGDSITLGGENEANRAWQGSPGFYIGLVSGGRVRHVRNAGVGGNNSAQMLARFDTDVTPYAPNIVSVLAGTNDSSQGVSDATFRANIKAIVAKILGIGAQPVLCTIPPITSAGTSQRQAYSRWNRWLALYSASTGIPLVDYHAALVNPANGNLAAAYDSGDGTHPNPAGDLAMATAWTAALNTLLPTAAPYTAKSNANPLNVIANGLFLTDSDSDGLADGWIPWSYPAPDLGTWGNSIVTDPNVAGGKVQRLTNTGAWGQNAIQQPINQGATTFDPGDRLTFSCLITTSGEVEGIVELVNYNSSETIPYMTATVDRTANVTRARIIFDDVVGPSTAQINVILSANTAGGTGTVDFGEVMVFNNTKNSLLTL